MKLLEVNTLEKYLFLGRQAWSFPAGVREERSAKAHNVGEGDKRVRN